MPYLRPALSRRLTRRTCLVCGYQGRQLQGPAGLTTPVCPGCNADLYSRPPRSYAEMEGLVDVAMAPNADRWSRPASPRPPRSVADDSRTSTPRVVVFLAVSITCAAVAFLLF